jgi:hypothetical protein
MVLEDEEGIHKHGKNGFKKYILLNIIKWQCTLQKNYLMYCTNKNELKLLVSMQLLL